MILQKGLIMWVLEVRTEDNLFRTYQAETWNEINTIFCCLMKIDDHAVQKAKYLIYEDKKENPHSAILENGNCADWVGNTHC